MPSVLTWRATTKGGLAVARADGHRETEYRDMDVETDHPAARAVRLCVDPKKGENLRAFTRKHQRQDSDGAVTGLDSVPVLEITTASGDTVRLYCYEDGLILTTEDLYR